MGNEDTKGILKSGTVLAGLGAVSAGLTGVLSNLAIVTPGELGELTANAVALISGLLVVWRRITATKNLSGLF